MKPLDALIIDDEPLAHDVIVAYIANIDFIDVAGQCYSVTEALEFLQDRSVDVIFLDINMPLLSGLDLLKVLVNKPQIIITSAYSEYALQSFELDVTDYLLKPFSFERFLQASNKVKQNIALLRRAKQADAKPKTPQMMYIKVDNRQVHINLAEVSCLEAYGNYVKVWRNDICSLTPRTLSSFEQELPEADFVRMHKSTMINMNHIESIDSHTVTLKDGKTFNIGKSYKKQLLQKVTKD